MDKLDVLGEFDKLDVLDVLDENVDENESGLVAGHNSGYEPAPVLDVDENEPGLG